MEKWIIPIIFLSALNVSAQVKLVEIKKTDTVIFVNYNTKDLIEKKKQRMAEARQLHKLTDQWDFEQFYQMPKFDEDLDKLTKQLKKQQINYKFTSSADSSFIADSSTTNLFLITDFEPIETKNHKYLMLVTHTYLKNGRGKVLSEGGELRITKKIKVIK